MARNAAKAPALLAFQPLPIDKAHVQVSKLHSENALDATAFFQADVAVELGPFLSESETDCKKLEIGLRQWSKVTTKSDIPESVSAPFGRMTANCMACRRTYLDIAPTAKH